MTTISAGYSQLSSLTIFPQTFKAHKGILATQSKYCKAMFGSGMKVCSPQTIGLINISPRWLETDVNPQESSGKPIDLNEYDPLVIKVSLHYSKKVISSVPFLPFIIHIDASI